MAKRLHPYRAFWLTKRFLKILTGREIWVRKDVQLPNICIGDWHIVPTHLGTAPLIYSLGVGDSIEFDLKSIARYGATVHAFDPTPFAIDFVKQQSLPEKFKLHPWAVGNSDGSLRMSPVVSRKGKKSKVMWTAINASSEGSIEVPVFCLPTIMDKLGHERIDLLKMDIEGFEYRILDNVLQMEHKPSQLLVEFHHRFPEIGQAKTREYLKKLRAAGYKVFAVSAVGREVAFIHDSAVSAAPS